MTPFDLEIFRRDENDELEAKLASTLNSLDHWKSQFEELERFVTPFRQDLAKYAAQSEHLDGENSKKARELQELHQQLAGTMGHQNQKQKIKYVVSIFYQNCHFRNFFLKMFFL